MQLERFGFSQEQVDQVAKILDDPAAGPILFHCASANRVGAVWDHPTKGVRVLLRHRFENKAELKTFGAFFEPKLGGIRIVRGQSVADIRYTVPETWDDAIGKVPGEEVRSK